MSNIFHSCGRYSGHEQSKDHLEMLWTEHARREVCHWAYLSTYWESPGELAASYCSLFASNSGTLAFKNEVSCPGIFLDSQFVRKFVPPFTCWAWLWAWECRYSKFKQCQTACCVLYFLTASYKPEGGKRLMVR